MADESRTDRLMRKAEEAADRNDIDQSDQYRVLAGQSAYMARKEAKALESLLAVKNTDA